MAAAAARAQIDPRRRSLIGKVHVAKKELGLSEDHYRDRLFRVTGKGSAADCSDAELVALIDDFKTNLNWQAKPKNSTSTGSARTGYAKRADHPTARKARALWISLYQLGAIHNKSEKALETFAAKQLNCARMQWADQSLMYKLIEALNAIARRNGWEPKQPSLKMTKIALLEAQLIKLKAKDYAHQSWNLVEAASRIAGFEAPPRSLPNWWEFGDIDAVADAFGHLLRTGRKDRP